MTDFVSMVRKRDFLATYCMIHERTGEGREGRTYELAGDRPYTLFELAAEASGQTGKEISYRNLSQTEHAAFLAI
ncbi:hypothetical protein [Rhizobium leguminosarum]|uniref:hypothetical protein n=1 Tax=Rhizobium leguminosarum TaxID=384 RepID=UPI00037D6EF9|nr:hypothetical protein [Rhizobium leguminosarum]